MLRPSPAYNARMDENKPRRRWLSFGIRDLLWAMVVVGMGIGWWAEFRNDRARAKLIEEVNYISVGMEIHESGPVRPQTATVSYPNGTTIKFVIPPSSWEDYE